MSKKKLEKDKKKKIKVKNKVKSKKQRNILGSIFKVNGNFNFLALLKNIILPVGGAIIVGFMTKGGMNIYNSLKKPIITPPSIVFPIVWTILYVLMGIAAYRIYMNNRSGRDDKGAYFYYLIQLSINFLWSFIFFNFRLYGISFILIIVLLVLIIITTIKFFKNDKLSGFLMIPYILWVSFASVLTFFIYMLNEM